jgi:hypothetical protein
LRRAIQVRNVDRRPGAGADLDGLVQDLMPEKDIDLFVEVITKTSIRSNAI